MSRKEPSLALKEGICKTCLERVYAMDPQINLDGAIYHQPCAKCADCFCQINLHNFMYDTSDDNVLLCKIHYKSRLKKDGNDDSRHSAKSPDTPKCSVCASLIVDTDTSNNSSPESESALSTRSAPSRLSIDRYALYERDERSPNFSPIVRIAARVESAKSKFRRALAKMSPSKKSPSKKGNSPIRDLGIDMVDIVDNDVVNGESLLDVSTEDNNHQDGMLTRLSNFISHPVRESPSKPNPFVNNGDAILPAPRRLMPRTVVGPTPSKGIKEGESIWDDDILPSSGGDRQEMEDNINSDNKDHIYSNKSNDNDRADSELDDASDPNVTKMSNYSKFLQSNSTSPSASVKFLDEVSIINEQEHDESKDVDRSLLRGDITNIDIPMSPYNSLSPYQIYLESQLSSNEHERSDTIDINSHSPTNFSPDGITTVKIEFPCDDNFPPTPPNTPASCSTFSKSSSHRKESLQVRSRSLFVSLLYFLYHGYIILIFACTVHSFSVWYDAEYPQDSPSVSGLRSPWIGNQNATRLINRRLQTVEERYAEVLGRNDWATVRMSLSSSVAIESCKSEDASSPIYIRTTAVFDSTPEELYRHFHSDKYEATQTAVDAYHDSSSLLLSPSEKISVMRKTTKKAYFTLQREMTVALVQHTLQSDLTYDNIKLKSLNMSSTVIPKGVLMSSMVNVHTDMESLKDESAFFSLENLKSHLLLEPLQNFPKPAVIFKQILISSPLSIYIPQINSYVEDFHINVAMIKVEIELFIEESCEFIVEYATENRIFSRAPKVLEFITKLDLSIRSTIRTLYELPQQIQSQLSSWIALCRSRLSSFSSSIQEYIASNQAVQDLIVSNQSISISSWDQIMSSGKGIFMSPSVEIVQEVPKIDRVPVPVGLYFSFAEWAKYLYSYVGVAENKVIPDKLSQNTQRKKIEDLLTLKENKKLGTDEKYFKINQDSISWFVPLEATETTSARTLLVSITQLDAGSDMPMWAYQTGAGNTHSLTVLNALQKLAKNRIL